MSLVDHQGEMSMIDDVEIMNTATNEVVLSLLVHVYGYGAEARPQKAPAQSNFSCLGRTVASKLVLNEL